MIRNYLNIAWRNLRQNYTVSLLNGVGLALGMTGCMLIGILVRFESNFDTFHTKKNRIYRVVSEFVYPEGNDYSAGIPLPLPPALRQDFPQVEQVAAIQAATDVQVSILSANQKTVEKKLKEEKGVFYAEPQFFNLFDFGWVLGNAATVLKQANSVALTQETAQRYFGDWQQAVGKFIRIDQGEVLRVAGILQDPPPNTDFPLKAVISYSSFKSDRMTRWGSISSNSQCFILLPSTWSARQMAALLPAFTRKHKNPELAKTDIHHIQPLTDLHFDSHYGTFSGHTMSREVLTALLLVGLALLIIACVNFINLATVQSLKRAKEIGIRKVLGSGRGQVFAQFLAETALIVLMALCIALVLAGLALPFLRSLLDQPLPVDWQTDPMLISYLIGLTVLVISLSGFYPGVILAGFEPIRALKSKITIQTIGGISLRKGLVVLQFLIAQVLIISTIVVISQMNYLRRATLGFDSKAVSMISLPTDSVHQAQFNRLHHELTQLPGINQISFCSEAPAGEGSSQRNFKFNQTLKDADFEVSLKYADSAFFTTFRLPLIAGRIYQRSDTIQECVVNETLLRKVGVRNPQDALGTYVVVGQKIVPIVGVVRDFHNLSLHSAIAPMIITTQKNHYHQVGVKLSLANMGQTLAQLKQVWETTFPDYVFESVFVDERIARFYLEENRLVQLTEAFSAIAILLSCLGLYGLVLFVARQRTKEIGVRKVLGASVSSIVTLLSQDFHKLVGVAIILSSPIAWYVLHHWLQGFAYHIDLSWWMFGAAGVLVITIALLTISYQGIKAALVNPVKSLRSE